MINYHPSIELINRLTRGFIAFGTFFVCVYAFRTAQNCHSKLEKLNAGRTFLHASKKQKSSVKYLKDSSSRT